VTACGSELIRAELDYLNEKEFPHAKNANARDFFDNSFVESLGRSGFRASVGFAK